MKKVAIMQVGWRRAFEGAMLAVMAGCGAFLFALMSSQEPNENLVITVGLAGVASGVLCLVSEIYTVNKALEKRRVQSLLAQTAASIEEVVEGCAWVAAATSFLGSTSFTVLVLINALTQEDFTHQVNPALTVAYTILPMSCTCMIIAVFMRPKDEGTGLKVLHLQIFLFGVVPEIVAAVKVSALLRQNEASWI